MSTENIMSKHESQRAEKMGARPTYAPPVDIYENKDEIVIFADLPGIATEKLAVHIDKEQLVIEAHRDEVGPGDEAFDYRRTFVVPRGIDADRIAANLQHGVLKLTLPKPAAMKPRQIEVRSA